MRTMLLILFFILTSVVMAQKAIEPTRVIVSAPQDAINSPLSAAIRSELRELRTVAIVQRSGDFDIQVNALPLVGCEGYATAVLLTDRDTGAGILRAYTSATIEGLARQIVREAKVNFQQKERAKAWR